MSEVTKWFPEIMYEDSEDGMTSKIPFIMIPKSEVMPKLLFMFESRETGEYEPDSNGDPLPIVEMELHQYADMIHLKKGLTPERYDEVRVCLGLKPLLEAVSGGKEITDRIREKVTKN
jgi:hypothetical protein|tara:strand:- start:310 stop:663 length:354 start_codon:yes stop_codon:yes gene_type:complete